MTTGHLTMAYSSGGDLKLTSGTIHAPAHSFISDQGNLWQEYANDQLQELIRLDDGWDGYRAAPVSFVNAVFALRMLESICGTNTPVPHIVPGVYGDLQIEWHTSKGEIELHVKAPNDVHAWRAIPESDEGEELNLKNDFAVIAAWVNQITESEIALIAAAA